MREYICIRKCFHGKGPTDNPAAPPRQRTYEEGEHEWFEEGEHVPRHFVPVDELQVSPPDKFEEAQKTVVKGLRAPIDQDMLAQARIRAAKKAAKKEGRPSIRKAEAG